jgi:glutamyl-tRNA synthetase
MEITHIIRGEEWISSTPKHILLYRYFGWKQPEFAHMPLLRNPDKTKMSKRKNDVSIPSYKEKGYLADALRNYLCLLGWSHPEEKDIFGIDEFIEKFSFDRMVKSGPIFDIKKLQWMNGKYIREQMSQDVLIEMLEPFLPINYPVELLPKVLPLVRDRLVTLADIDMLTEFFYKAISPKKEDMMGKKGAAEDAKMFLEGALSKFETVEAWSAKTMESLLLEYCDGKSWNRGAFFMAIRVAVSGRTATPPLFDMIEVLGRELTLQRLRSAIALF